MVAAFQSVALYLGGGTETVRNRMEERSRGVASDELIPARCDSSFSNRTQPSHNALMRYLDSIESGRVRADLSVLYRV